MGYDTSKVYYYNENFELAGEVDLLSEINKNGIIEATSVVGGRSICTNFDRSLYFIPTNRTHRRLYIFDSNMEWTGCYISLLGMSSSPESIYMGNNGNLFVSADTERNVYEYSFTLTTGWDVEVGQLENTYDLSAVIPSQITGLVQDRETDNWYIIANLENTLITLDSSFNVISTVKLQTRLGSLITNFQALEKLGDSFLVNSVNNNVLLIYDKNGKMIKWKFQTQDTSLIGICVIEDSLTGNDLAKTLNYFN